MSYKWKKGDIFALNNRLVMHSRNAYTGARKVYASMFGNAIGSNRVTRDGVGHVLTDFTALRVSDPTTFGMWRLDNPEETVYNAIRAGYRRFDSAVRKFYSSLNFVRDYHCTDLLIVYFHFNDDLKCDYGNEEQTGKGIRRAIDEGIVKREDLYITTKLWNTYHDQEHVPLALDRCLTDLGLDYVDEFLIHFPISMEVRKPYLHLSTIPFD